MKLELTNTDWTLVEGLDDGSTYFLQAKKAVDLGSYNKQEINFARGDAEPADDTNAFFASAFKFKASGNTYVKAIACPTIIYIEEV